MKISSLKNPHRKEVERCAQRCPRLQFVRRERLSGGNSIVFDPLPGGKPGELDRGHAATSGTAWPLPE